MVGPARPFTYVETGIPDADYDELQPLEAEAGDLLAGISDMSARCYLLRTFKEIPTDQRAQVLSIGQRLFERHANGDDRCEILDVIKEMPKDDRADVVNRALPALEGIHDVGVQCNILYAIIEMKPPERALVMEKAQPLLAELDGMGRIRLLKAIRQGL